MKKQLFLCMVSLCFLLPVYGQTDNGVTPATARGGAGTALLRNWESMGINPANLGHKENFLISAGIFNFGISAQSKALDAKQLRDALQNPEDTFTTADKQKYASVFTTPDGLNLQAQVMWGALSFASPKLGGIGVSVRDRSYAHVGLNHNAADLIFNGQNAAFLQDTATYSKSIGEVFDSTNLSYLHFREINISYGRRLFTFGKTGEDGEKQVQFFGGAGVKMLWGLGNAELKAENGVLSGHASLSDNLGVNLGTVQNFDLQNSDAIFSAVGNGVAFDAGISLVAKEKFRFGIAVTDLGGITWKNNLMISTDTAFTAPDTTNNGINSWNVGSQGSFAFATNGAFNYGGPGPDYKTALPARLRMGAGIKLERFEIGAEAVIPMNDVSYNLGSPYFSLGAEYNFLGFVKASAGISGNSEWGISVPLGLFVGIGGVVETGVATGDVLSILGSSTNPNISASFFALRINIKKPKPRENALPTI